MPSLKKNVLYQSLYQVLLLLAPLVTAPYVSRVLGPEGVGLYSWTLSIAQYFVLLAMLGITNHGARTIARVRGDREQLNREFSDLLAVHLVISALALVAYVAFVVGFVEQNQVLFAAQGLWIVAAALDLNWFFSGIEQFGLLVVRNTIVKVAMIVAIFTFVRQPEDLWLYVTIFALGTSWGTPRSGRSSGRTSRSEGRSGRALSRISAPCWSCSCRSSQSASTASSAGCCSVRWHRRRRWGSMRAPRGSSPSPWA